MIYVGIALFDYQLIWILSFVSLANTFDLEDLYERFKQLSDFEIGANTIVIESGLLKGMNADDIKFAGKHMQLLDG